MIVDCRLSSLGAVIGKTQSLYLQERLVVGDPHSILICSRRNSLGSILCQSLTAALLLEAFFVISVANKLTVRSKLHCLFPSPAEAGVPAKVA